MTSSAWVVAHYFEEIKGERKKEKESCFDWRRRWEIEDSSCFFSFYKLTVGCFVASVVSTTCILPLTPAKVEEDEAVLQDQVSVTRI
jgi:hypothetical protein